MTRTTLLLALAAAAALAGCNKENHTIIAGSSDNIDDNIAANAPVALPPAIAASKVYRCADNAVVHVDWMSDGKTANVHTDKGPPTTVSAAEAGKPMTAAGGYEVSGSATDASAKIAVPGHPSQSCKA
ncbi:MAG: hypothetical protein ACJ8FT_06785 [Sphingomonas sp.]